MYTNPTAPPLFREIFKNAFLPFKDPSTLGMFLKEIDEFHYSHSEKLGDAFEYLLSFMGSQGDAGQFRTPRHIIDFIVEIVNPRKYETVLDPACGTAGFLIASYKHILARNADKRPGDKLSAKERKALGGNLAGYDISPDMTRLSLVNMYLHQFASPRIHEYDTLSSEDRWNEYYDVILANPPFFSPKGGIKPHSRFGVNSTRAEVLFVDYIMEHLKPQGRAGVVVPEGIVFQTGTAYKLLRRKLVETCLAGVISLPAGVFQPYSGVKTSVLILDKELNAKSDEIFFAKVENDGFSLGAQRTEISSNDLPEIVSRIQNFFENTEADSDLETAAKKDILEKKDVTLTNPITRRAARRSDFEFVSVTDVSSFHRGVTYKKKDEVFEGGTGVLRANNISLNGSLVLEDIKLISDEVKTKDEQWLRRDDIFMCIASGSKEHIGKTTLIERDMNFVFGGFMGVLRASEQVIPRFLISILQNERFNQFLRDAIYGSNINNIKKDILADFYFPLPPIEVQQEIVDELEGYRKVIDGCRQVVESYKPVIDIDPSWERKNMGDACDVRDGTHDSPKYVNDGYPLITSKNVIDGDIDFSNVNLISQDDLDKINKRSKVSIGDILMPMIGTIGRPTIVNIDKEFAIKNVALVKCDNETVLSGYVRTILDSDHFANYLRQNEKGSTQKFISLGALRSFPLPIPDIDVQKQIVAEIQEQMTIVLGNKKLIEIHTRKIQDRIAKVWGERGDGEAPPH